MNAHNNVKCKKKTVRSDRVLAKKLNITFLTITSSLHNHVSDQSDITNEKKKKS